MWLSIIIPVYNAKDYLENCIRSILQNDISGCEIILVDDGSTDGVSSALCDRLSEQYDAITCIHKANGGAGDARNVGLRQAGGVYAAFVDSDDMISPCMLTTLRRAAAQYESDVIFFGMEATDEHRTYLMPQPKLPLRRALTLKESPELLLTMPAAWTAIWKRELFEKHNIWFRARGWGEDLCMTRKMLAAAESVVVLPDTLYRYYLHEGSVTARKDPAHNREIIGAIDEVLQWYRDKGLFDEYRKELCKLCVDNVFYDAAVRVLKATPSHPLLAELWTFTETNFPEFWNNPYLRTYSRKKRLIMRMLMRRRYRCIHLLFRLSRD